MNKINTNDLICGQYTEPSHFETQFRGACLVAHYGMSRAEQRAKGVVPAAAVKVDEEVLQAIREILASPPGSRILPKNYGTQLSELLDKR